MSKLFALAMALGLAACSTNALHLPPGTKVTDTTCENLPLTLLSHCRTVEWNIQ